MTNKSVSESFDREGHEAVNAVVDALSAWREEVAASTARYSQTVLDKMTTAATAMGWPKEVVDASRTHFEQASKMQTNMIDHLMDAWQEQLKSPMPGPFNVQLPPFPGMGFGASQNSTFQLRPSSFGWKRRRHGSATGRLHGPCGPAKLLGCKRGAALHQRIDLCVCVPPRRTLSARQGSLSLALKRDQLAATEQT